MDYTTGFITEIERKITVLNGLEDEIVAKEESLKEYFENSNYKDKVEEMLTKIHTNINESITEFNNAKTAINNL